MEGGIHRKTRLIKHGVEPCGLGLGGHAVVVAKLRGTSDTRFRGTQRVGHDNSRTCCVYAKVAPCLAKLYWDLGGHIDT